MSVNIAMDIIKEEDDLFECTDATFTREKFLNMEKEEDKQIDVQQEDPQSFIFIDESKYIAEKLNMKGIKEITIKEEKKDSESGDSTDDSDKKVILLDYRFCSETNTSTPSVKCAITPEELERVYSERKEKEIQTARDALILLKCPKFRAKRKRGHKISRKAQNISAAQQGCAHLPPSAVTSPGSTSLTHEDNMTSTPTGKMSKSEMESAARTPHVRGSAAIGTVHRINWTKELNECLMRAYYEATEGETYFISYRGRMLSIFQTLQPALAMTKQQLFSQLWRIQHHQLLSESTLERLRNATPCKAVLSRRTLLPHRRPYN